jgi:hypothetical protein
MEQLVPELHRAEARWPEPVSPADRETLLAVLGQLQYGLGPDVGSP